MVEKIDRMKFLTRHLVILLWLPTTVSAELILGVHPFRDAAEITRSFSPLGDYLSEKLGEKVAVRVMSTSLLSVRPCMSG